MSTTADQRTRADEIRELPVRLDAAGRIIDRVDPARTRADTLEERVRQYYVNVLIEEYGYSPSLIGVECAINIGSESRSADIVVYHTPEAAQDRDQGNINIIVECKSPTVEDGFGQLTSYVMASSASGGVWFNGGLPAYYRRVTDTRTELQQWTNIPRSGELWESVGHYSKEDLRPPRELKQVFQRCHNAIYRSGQDSEDIAIDMVKIILAKYRDEQNAGDLCEFRCTPEEMANAPGQTVAAARVRHLFSQVINDHPDVFTETDIISIGDKNLCHVINELQIFKFIADDDVEQVYDIIGTAFEVYVSSHLKGARGQFFTNRLVVEMMMSMLVPSEGDIIYDPACGSGGFLISSLRFVRDRILGSERSPASKQREINLLRQRLFGTDISPRLVRVAKTNLVLNGDGHSGIYRANSLNESDLREVQFPLSAHGQQPSLILTNPPFGASHELRERDRSVLRHFDLGHVWEPNNQGTFAKTDRLNSREGVPPETLFLEKCIRMLRPGGRMGIVIAKGILDNRDAIGARQYILENCYIRAIVNCHANTFAPFNGTKACIIFLEKKEARGISRAENYQIFMAINKSVGQDSQGNEIHQTNDNGEKIRIDGQYVLDHDLDEIVASYAQFRNGSDIIYESAWTIPASRIVLSDELRMNPTRFAPQAEQAAARVNELSEQHGWRVERLGDFANVFNGPRFKRPFAAEGAAEGGSVIRMYTPKAFFEERAESVKLLDRNRASALQLRQLDVLTINRGDILIVDSGTAGKLLGRVGMATEEHDGQIANNNLIRVVISDPLERAYVYQFLRSSLGQDLLLSNVYGTNQDHIEPEDVKNIPIPFPSDAASLDEISQGVTDLLGLRDRVRQLDQAVALEFETLFSAIT